MFYQMVTHFFSASTIIGMEALFCSLARAKHPVGRTRKPPWQWWQKTTFAIADACRAAKLAITPSSPIPIVAIVTKTGLSQLQQQHSFLSQTNAVNENRVAKVMRLLLSRT